MLQVVIRPRAAADLETATDFYTLEASPLVAERFVAEFQAACAVLALYPGLGSLRFAYLLDDAELRTWSLTRFPFRFFYVVEGDKLEVLAVEHERRNVAPAALGPLGRMKKGSAQ